MFSPNDSTATCSTDVTHLLDVAYHGNKEQRAVATSALESALGSAEGPYHLRALLATALDPHTPSQRSLSALIYVKNCLKQHIISEETLCADPTLLPTLQEMLLDGALRVPASHRRMLRECADVMIGQYDWNYLPRILPLLERVNAAQTPCEQAAALLEMTYTQVKRYKDTLFAMASAANINPDGGNNNNSSNNGMSHLAVCDKLMRVLPQFTHYDDPSFALWHIIFKIMECVVETMLRSGSSSSSSSDRSTRRDRVNSRAGQEGPEQLFGCLDEWLSVMARFPEAHVARAQQSGYAGYARYVLCVKRIAMITVALVQQATTLSPGNRRRRAEGCGSGSGHHRLRGAALGQHFVVAHAECFLLVWKGWLSHCITARNNSYSNSNGNRVDYDAASLHRKSEVAALRYLQASVRVVSLYTTQLRPCALAVVEQLLFPYLCLGTEEEIFADVTDLDAVVEFLMTQSWCAEGGGGGVEFTPRQVACNTILALVEAAVQDSNHDSNGHGAGGSKKATSARKKVHGLRQSSNRGGNNNHTSDLLQQRPQQGLPDAGACGEGNGCALLNDLWTVITSGLSASVDERSNAHKDENGTPSSTHDSTYTLHQGRIYGFLGLLMALRRVLLRRAGKAGVHQVAMTVLTAVVPRMVEASALPPVLRCQALLTCERFAGAVVSLSSSATASSPLASMMSMATGAEAAAVQHRASRATAELVACVMECVTDNDARVRLFAINTICTLLSRSEAERFLRPCIAALMHECLYFLNRVHTTFVPNAILYLTTHFAPELTTVMGELGCTLVQHFLAVAFDLAAQEEGDGGADCGNANTDSSYPNGSMSCHFIGSNTAAGALSKYEQTAFSGTALLDAIATVVEFSDNNPAAIGQMTPSLVALIRRILEEPDNFDFMERGLGLLTTLVGLLRNAMTPECWALLPLLFAIWENGIGVDLFTDVAGALDNFLCAAPDNFITQADVMERLWTGCQRMLLGPVMCEDDARIAAVQLIQSVLHQCWGGCVQPRRMHPYLTRCLGLLLQSLASLTCPTPSPLNGSNNDTKNRRAGCIHHRGDVQVQPRTRLRVWLVAAVMDCFLYDAPATVLAMSAMAALEPFWRGVLYEMFAPDDRCDLSNNRSSDHRNRNVQRADEAALSPWRCLSLLTRKVCILGTTAFMQSALSSEASAAVWTAHGVALLRFVEDCIFASESVYARRVACFVQLTARRRRRHNKVLAHRASSTMSSDITPMTSSSPITAATSRNNSADDGIGYAPRDDGLSAKDRDSVADNVLPPCTAALLAAQSIPCNTDKTNTASDDDSDEFADVSEGDDELGDALCGSDENDDEDADEDMEGASEAMGSSSSLLHDETDEYESPLDGVNEVLFFLNWRRGSAACDGVGEEGGGWRSVGEYERAAGVVEEHRQAQQRLETTEKQHMVERMAQEQV